MSRARLVAVGFVLFFISPLAADTVILKNGKRFENVAARPLPGGRLRITFGNGRVIFLKRDAVRSLFIAPTVLKKAPRSRRRPRARIAAAKPKRVRKPVKKISEKKTPEKNTQPRPAKQPAPSEEPRPARVVYRKEPVARVTTTPEPAARRAPAAKAPPTLSPWSLAVPGVRFEGEGGHNWLVFGYLLTGSLIVAQGNTALATARSDFDFANNLGVASIAGNVSFGFDQTAGLVLFRELRLAAAKRGYLAADQMNLGALLIVGAYLYNAWELKWSGGVPARSAPGTGSAAGARVELNLKGGNRFAARGDSELRVSWSLRF